MYTDVEYIWILMYIFLFWVQSNYSISYIHIPILPRWSPATVAGYGTAMNHHHHHYRLLVVGVHIVLDTISLATVWHSRALGAHTSLACCGCLRSAGIPVSNLRHMSHVLTSWRPAADIERTCRWQLPKESKKKCQTEAMQSKPNGTTAKNVGQLS